MNALAADCSRTRGPSRIVLSVLLLVTIRCSAWPQAGSQPILEQDAAGLVAILKNPQATTFEKAKACQRLAVVGSPDAIPAIAALLADEKLNVYARTALENISDPAAVQALLRAAKELHGRPQVGVIDSIGQCGSDASVPLLVELLGGRDADVTSAAASALGNIGSKAAAESLMAAFRQTSTHKDQLANACLVCADKLASRGQGQDAVPLCQLVSESEVPPHLRIAALRSLLRIQGGAAHELLLAQLRSPDQAFFDLGLAAASEIPGRELTELLSREVQDLPPNRRAVLIRVLGDRDDAPLLDQLRIWYRDKDPAVQKSVLAALVGMEDPGAGTMLLEAALKDDAMALAARQGLKSRPGRDVDALLVAEIVRAQGRQKKVLLELVGARRIAEALPAVRTAVRDSDKKVRIAAYYALGQLATLEDLSDLIKLTRQDQGPIETRAAQSALGAAALRMTDREACARILAEGLQGATANDSHAVLDLLGQLGGATALSAVATLARTDDPEQKDAATRLLGRWPHAEAAQPLLEIARTETDPKYQVRALRGYLRIARQLQLSDDERLAMFRQAMELAQRDDERRLAVDVLTRVPSPVSLELAVSLLDKKELAAAAAEAALSIAPKIRIASPEAAAQALRQIANADVSPELKERAQQLLRTIRGG